MARQSRNGNDDDDDEDYSWYSQSKPSEECGGLSMANQHINREPTGLNSSKGNEWVISQSVTRPGNGSSELGKPKESKKWSTCNLLIKVFAIKYEAVKQHL